MSYNPDINHRRSILNQIGRIIDYHWKRLPIDFKNIELDQYQIMPNHFQGIIHIVGAKHLNVIEDDANVNTDVNASPLQIPHGTNSGSLGAIIQNFKSVASRQINK